MTSYLNSINAGEIKIHNTSEYLNKLQNLSKFINEVHLIIEKIFFLVLDLIKDGFFLFLVFFYKRLICNVNKEKSVEKE